MRIETASKTVEYRGILVPNKEGELRYKLEKMGSRMLLGFFSDSIHSFLWVDSLPHLLNFYRDLGALLDEAQPGLTNPLPDGDPSELDAMKVVFEADQLRKGITC